MVLDVDPEERRIALSVKSLQLSKGEEDYQAYLRKQGDGRVSLGDALKSKGIVVSGVPESGNAGAEGEEESADTAVADKEESTDD